MGGEEFSEIYKQQLTDYIEETFLQYKAHNESKNIFKAAQTPSVYFFVALLTYIISGIFALLGLETFCNFFTLIMTISIVALCVWAYVRYSGELYEVGVKLDQVAEMMWEKVLQPVYECCLEKKVKEVSSQAISAATGLNQEHVSTAMGVVNATSKQSQKSKRQTPNGKLKHS
jgi:atlastin